MCNIRCLKGKAVLFNNGVILNKKILFDNIGTFKFVYVGRLVRLKNVDKMIHLIKILVENNYDVSFDIIGAGPQETFLKNLTAELSLDKYINFIGYAEDVLSFLYKSHCLLLMSDHEGMPNVILEAMSIGLPIISTDVGAVRYMINDDSYLVDDIDDLYRKAILLINNQDKANVYSALLYSRCQTVFSMEIITEQYRNLYLSVNK